jgi:hypothetical protein
MGELPKGRRCTNGVIVADKPCARSLATNVYSSAHFHYLFPSLFQCEVLVPIYCSNTSAMAHIA